MVVALVAASARPIRLLRASYVVVVLWVGAASVGYLAWRVVALPSRTRSVHNRPATPTTWPRHDWHRHAYAVTVGEFG